MNYLITAAGHGSRFCQAGIKPPKPLIKARGKELLLWSLSSFSIGHGDNLYIATVRKHRVRDRLENLICFLYPNSGIHWLEIDEVLEGQLLTTLYLINEFNLSGPVVVHNCDTYHDASNIAYSEFLDDDGCFGLIPCFKGKGDHWSFVKCDEQDETMALQVAEKSRISDNASVGTYVFRDAAQLPLIANSYKADRPCTTELYIAPLYQYAIELGFVVKKLNAAGTRLFGTPNELIETFDMSYEELLSENAWHAHQRGTLVVDIDGTLCSGSHNGDYSQVKPIEEMCSALRKANEDGYYIVLLTARNMRTFRGSLGLINKHTAPILLEWLHRNNIPYDEIYYGKPWGPSVQYIDDKSISIQDFIESSLT